MSLISTKHGHFATLWSRIWLPIQSVRICLHYFKLDMPSTCAGHLKDRHMTLPGNNAVIKRLKWVKLQYSKVLNGCKNYNNKNSLNIVFAWGTTIRSKILKIWNELGLERSISPVQALVYEIFVAPGGCYSTQQLLVSLSLSLSLLICFLLNRDLLAPLCQCWCGIDSLYKIEFFWVFP